MGTALGTMSVAALTFATSISVAATAGRADLPTGNKRTEVLFLGTAGGPPLHADRSEPSTLLIVDGQAYLIDCGIGTMGRMLEAGVNSGEVRTIFFTHLHADHDLGLADVMANDFFMQSTARRAEPINIYGPPQTKELVDSAFHFITIGFRPFENFPPRPDGSFDSPFVTHEFDRDGVIFQDGKIRVTAAENSHYALMPPQRRGQFKSFAFRFETPHGALVFTGDTGPSAAVERLAMGADVLVAEANSRDPQDAAKFTATMAARKNWSPEQANSFRAHFEVEHLNTFEIGRLAAKTHVKTVLLYHYVPQNKADQAAYVRGVQTAFSGPVFAPNDLDRYCLDGGGLSRCPD